MPSKKDNPAPIQTKMKGAGKRLEFKSDAEIEAWEREKQSRQMITDSVKEAKEHIGKQPPEQLLFSFMPTTMTRTTPFFPMSKRQMKNRPYDELTWETPWGRISVQGKRLSVYDETVLLSLLAVVKKQKSEDLRTSQHELCKIMDVTPCKDTYNAIWGGINRLVGTKIDIEIWEGKGRKRKLIQAMTGTIINWAGKDAETGKLKVILNPYFLQMYAEGFLTNLDLKFRAKLKGDMSKALYRFLQGQEPFYKKGKYEIQLLKLCIAINLQTDNTELFRLREQIRLGLRELRRQCYLERWKLNKQDYVIVWKSDKVKRLV
jgi:hypothetical protein